MNNAHLGQALCTMGRKKQRIHRDSETTPRTRNTLLPELSCSQQSSKAQQGSECELSVGGRDAEPTPGYQVPGLKGLGNGK